jgi:putative intracellular protease/amidase
MRNVLIVIGDAAETVDTLYPYYRVQEEGFDIEVCGGIFVDEPCVIDGNLVSGRTYHDHGRYIGAWVKLLKRAAGLA